MISADKKLNIKSKEVTLHLDMFTRCYPAMAIKSIHQLSGEEEDDGGSRTYCHDHDYYELVIVEKGRGVHFRNGKEEFIHPGMVFLLHPGELHSFSYTEKMILLTFMISPALVSTVEDDLKSLPGYRGLFDKDNNSTLIVTSQVVAELNILMNDIADEQRNMRAGGKLLVTGKIIEVLVLVLRECVSGDRGIPVRNIAPAVSYMLRHYGEDLKISRLARLASLSESSFYRRFCREFGMSPQKYLLYLRLHKAEELLVDSGMSINEISAVCGFNDPLYFSRQFRNYSGVSPREYRKNEHGAWQRISGLKKVELYTDEEKLF